MTASRTSATSCFRRAVAIRHTDPTSACACTPLIHSLVAVPAGYPEITKSPTLRAVERGRPAQMTCEASGSPEPEINWLKDYVPVDLSDRRLSLDSGSNNPTQPLLNTSHNT